MDVIRPTPVPGFLGALLSGVSMIADQMKSLFYKNWRMIGNRTAAPAQTSKG
jgi:beta-hydroxylase